MAAADDTAVALPHASIARVIVDQPLPQLDRLLDYRIPAGMTDVAPGVRVSVPLRTANRMTQGFVVELSDQQEFPGPLSDIDAVVSPVPVLRPEVWALARAVSDRAAGSVIDVLRLAIPKRQVRVEKAWLAAREAGRAEPAAAPLGAPAVTGYREGQVASLLDSRGRAALAVESGVVELAGRWIGRWAIALAQLAARTVAAGESAILVVPDHRDERQLAHALTHVLPDELVVRLDASQPNPERYRGLLRAIGERPVAIVGNRSAIYAPATRLGLIVVWNDGDPLLGEPLSPYVHARDAALVRQDQQGTALVFAGHTRTTEVQRLVELGFLSELAPERSRRPRVVATANAPDTPDAHARIPALAWREAAEAVTRGPVLVQVARPGYAPGLRCAECGTAARCRRCAGPLQLARQGAAPSCLWCGIEERPWRCAQCSANRLARVGSGSVRTAEELGRAFPGARVVVADGERRVLEVDDRPALVVATRGAEPIAAGGYRAILLLDGERMLGRETLRVAEDCLRWWADAASLAADGASVMLVGVGGRLATALTTGNIPAFSAAELADRRALAFPPVARFATLEGAPDAVADACEALAGEAAVVGERVLAGRARAILRFDYGAGPAVARTVRGEIIRQSTRRRKPIPGSSRNRRAELPLRARFDDPEPFEEG